METGLPTGSIMKCNFWLTVLLLVKLTLSFLIIHYNAGHPCTMQELVKAYSNNGFAILLKLSP